MDFKRIEQALAQTLADNKLSSSEKKALASILTEVDSDRERDLVRAKAFELARNASDSARGNVLDWLEEVTKLLAPSAPTGNKTATGGKDSAAFFSPRDDCAGAIIRLLGSAKSNIDICVFTITDDRLSDAIANAHTRRVRLRIITDNEKAFDLGSDIQRLRDHGVPTRIDKTEFHMHHKFALFDGGTLLTGSYNWTRGAARDNAENFLVTRQADLVTSYSQAFDRLWDELADD